MAAGPADPAAESPRHYSGRFLTPTRSSNNASSEIPEMTQPRRLKAASTTGRAYSQGVPSHRSTLESLSGINELMAEIGLANIVGKKQDTRSNNQTFI